MKNIITTLAILGTFSFVAVPSLHAGTLYPTSEPGETMYSLQEIYDLITASTTSEIGDGSSFLIPGISGSMVTLTELYNAVFALKNASLTEDNNEDDDVIVDTPTDPEPENLTDHSNISSTFKQSFAMLDTVNTGRYHFQFEVTAIDKDIYIKKDVDIKHVLFGDTPVLDQVTRAETTLIQLASYDDLTEAITEGSAVNGYFVVPAGTTKLFRQKVSVDNTGGTSKMIKLGLDSLEYKVGSDNAGFRIFDLNQKIYQTNPLGFIASTI